jgi:hypothetical protein
LLATLLRKIGAVEKSADSHQMIVSAMERHFEDLSPLVFDAACKATGRSVTKPDQRILETALHLFDQLKADIRAALEIERFEFSRPRTAPIPRPTLQATAQPIPKNSGGKPLAPHWDAMWAEIAYQLWCGGLKPERQADITKAMNDWLADKGHEAGETAVTKRARALWQRMERG